MHEYIPELKESLRKGEVTRREFVRTATLLGMSAARRGRRRRARPGRWRGPPTRASGAACCASPPASRR